MAHNKPLGLRFKKHLTTATNRPLATAGLTAGTPQRCDAECRPWDVGVAEGSLKRRDPTFTPIARWRNTFNSLIEVAGEDDRAELHAQVADEQQECHAHGPPLGALIVDVNIGDGEKGARLVGRPADFDSNHHAFDVPRRVPERAGDLDRRAREVAREDVLVEEYGAMVLGDHVEVLRQGTVSDKACTFLCADNLPRAVEVACQRALVRTNTVREVKCDQQRTRFHTLSSAYSSGSSTNQTNNGSIHECFQVRLNLRAPLRKVYRIDDTNFQV